jgi:hypothetical protein
MGFTAPWVLAGLALAALPILLHLVQRREPPERAFPAVRYLEDATRDHRRQLRLRHLLLLALRTLLVIALVLAAAGAFVRGAMPFGQHAPSALVLILDHSASTTAVWGGEPALVGLRRAADAVLARATAGDRLWLLTASGIPRAGSAEALRAVVAGLEPAAAPMDLGAAVAVARDLLAGVDRPGEVIVLTDAQGSAVTPLRGEGPLTVLRPRADPPPNRGLAPLEAGAQPWGGDGGRVTAALLGDAAAPVAAVLAVDDRTVRELLLTGGGPVPVPVPPLAPGWHELRLALAPDEFRFDDTARIALRVAPPAAVAWTPGDRWLDAALAVLSADGRIRAGAEITLGTLGRGRSLVLPPSDPALLPALNRALAARGVRWRYGTVRDGPSVLDSGAVLPFQAAVSRRVVLEPATAGAGEVLVTANGAPWAVRDGEVVLLGSRLDPAWSELPLTAGFVPLLDHLLTRTLGGDLFVANAIVGTPVGLPGQVTAVARAGEVVAVEGGAPWRAPNPGVYYLLRGADTVGAVTAALPEGESDLTPLSADELRDRWPGAVVRTWDDAEAAAFANSGRGDLRPLLLLLALGCVVGESLLAGRGRSVVR